MTHDQRHRAIVEALARELTAVRPLWPVHWRLALWLTIAIVILVHVLVTTPNHYALKLEHPAYALQVACFTIAAVLLAAMGLRAAVPGRAPAAKESVFAAGLAVTGTAMLWFFPVGTTGFFRQFVAIGMPCARATCFYALVPWIALWWAIRRGAPMKGRAAGAMVGGAAMLFSFAVMRLYCPIDEQLHLLTWHLAPVIVIIALSALAGSIWLNFPRRARGPVAPPARPQSA